MEKPPKPLGALGPDQPDPRDYRLAEVQETEKDLPDTYLLIDMMMSIQDQNYGTCTSHAADGVKEYWDGEKLSQKFIYHNTKKISGLWNNQGDFLRNAFKSLQKYGVCLEETFPDNSEDNWEDYVKKEPSQEAYKEAEKFKAKSYWRVEPNLDDIRSAIYKNEVPVGISMGWYKAYYDERDDGYLPVPGDNKYGGHAINCVGWDKDKLWFRNSHGTDYGKDGYFYIPFNEFDKHEIWDAWVALDLEPQEGWVADSYLKPVSLEKGSIMTPSYNLHLRKAPWNDIITTVKPGDKLKVLGESHKGSRFNWQKIRLIN